MTDLTAPSHDPKAELHVHLEQAVRADMLFELASRNGVALPAGSPAELAELLRFRDLAHFISVVRTTMVAFSTARDFHDAVVDYAQALHGQGALYAELGFSPMVHERRGVDGEAIFSGVCDGMQDARERFGVELRAIPDISRDMDLDAADRLVDHAIAFADRGVVGVGLAGPEAGHPPERFAGVFARAIEAGLRSAPHAGEAAGPESVWAAIDLLGAERVRHCVRAAEDPALLGELADRAIVCDVCLHSNLRLGVYGSLEKHPLPTMLAAGVRCTVSTDDPTFFDCDLTSECEAARSLGVASPTLFETAVEGAFCEPEVKERLRRAAAAWSPR